MCLAEPDAWHGPRCRVRHRKMNRSRPAWHRSMPAGRSRARSSLQWARGRCGPPRAAKNCSRTLAVVRSRTFASACWKRQVAAGSRVHRDRRKVRRRARSADAARGTHVKHGGHGANCGSQRRNGAAQAARAEVRLSTASKAGWGIAPLPPLPTTIWQPSVARTTQFYTARRCA